MNKKLKLFLLLLLPLIVYFIVCFMINYIPNSVCFWKKITSHDCWGCGMTRAFYYLFHLQFKMAYDVNPRVVIVAPLLLFIWIKNLFYAFKNADN